MSLIDDTNDVGSEIIDVAGDVTTTAANLAIEGAQAALGSSRRLKGSTLAVIVLLLVAVLGLRRWRADKDKASDQIDRQPSSPEKV